MRQFSGALMRTHRRAARLRTEELAVKIGRSASIVLSYEHGRVVPPTAQLPAIADALGIDICGLFDEVRNAD
jgi:ribosome-binding protein aMBF1 (putative translation factor)